MLSGYNWLFILWQTVLANQKVGNKLNRKSGALYILMIGNKLNDQERKVHVYTLHVMRCWCIVYVRVCVCVCVSVFVCVTIPQYWFNINIPQYWFNVDFEGIMSGAASPRSWLSVKDLSWIFFVISVYFLQREEENGLDKRPRMSNKLSHFLITSIRGLRASSVSSLRVIWLKVYYIWLSISVAVLIDMIVIQPRNWQPLPFICVYLVGERHKAYSYFFLSIIF